MQTNAKRAGMAEILKVIRAVGEPVRMFFLNFLINLYVAASYLQLKAKSTILTTFCVSDEINVKINPDKLPDPDVTPTNVNPKPNSKANTWTANILMVTACTVYWIIF